MENGSTGRQIGDKVAEKGGSLRLTSSGAAFVQGVCVFPMLGNSLKVFLGDSATAPVRILLMIHAGVWATISVYLIWNGWRLRNPPEARGVVW